MYFWFTPAQYKDLGYPFMISACEIHVINGFKSKLLKNERKKCVGMCFYRGWNLRPIQFRITECDEQDGLITAFHCTKKNFK